MMGWFRWLWRRVLVPPPAPTPHYYPAFGSLDQFIAGIDRRKWCLRYDPSHRSITNPPCPRKKPTIIYNPELP